MSVDQSPVYAVKAVPLEKIVANDYNPNIVAPPEMKLLELSIWEDGFTMPCVCYYDNETDRYILVDGYHRYSVLRSSKRIYQRENGLLPVVVIDKELSNRMASTIRHNRARGSHNIELMCHIVAELDKAGMSDQWIMKNIGMDRDELLRLKQISGLAQSAVPQFQKTEIKEFARLNNSLAKLMQKDKEIYRIQKEFTENASHELQTPISIIRSKLDLLMQEELDERSMSLVSDLYDLNTRMEHLNRNLLLLAKIENSQYTEMEEVDLGSFIREAMPTYNVLHSDLNISFLDQRTCHVVHNVNTILLSCLLNNLVVNAIRHTAAMNGEIRLLLCNSYFTVSNPADGVSLNARTLFQRFSSDDTKTSGNGLGLSIAKAICDYHGWRLQYVFEENHHVFSVHFR